MAEARINATIKRRALEQATFHELREAYISKVMANPFLPDAVQDLAADVVDHHMTSMGHELERLELTVSRIGGPVESLLEPNTTNGVCQKKATPKKRARAKDKT